MVAIDRVVTHGTFELDGGSWEVDNNIWLIGDNSNVVVFDAAHDAAPIVEAVGGRHVVAVVCTHGHNDHVTVAPELGKTLDAPVLLHPADEVLWRMTHPDKDFRSISDGETLSVGGTELRALHTPGHSPGSVCWYSHDLGVVFSGDTLFSGGPGATGRSYSDFPTILRSISERLGKLPGETVVHTGHGDSTTSATRSSTTRSGWPAATRGSSRAGATAKSGDDFRSAVTLAADSPPPPPCGGCAPATSPTAPNRPAPPRMWRHTATPGSPPNSCARRPVADRYIR